MIRAADLTHIYILPQKVAAIRTKYKYKQVADFWGKKKISQSSLTTKEDGIVAY